MTVSTTTNRVSYAGNGSTQIFAVPFIFFDEADLVVIETVDSTGVSTTKTLATHYTTSGGDGEDGSVTMLTAPASGTTLTILREPTRTQTLDLVENDPLPAEDLETALDKVTTITQRNRDLINRTIRQPDGDTADIGVLPSKVDRASKFMGFDGDGNPIAADGTSADLGPVSVFVNTLLDDADAAAVLTTLTVTQDVSGAAATPVLTKLKERVSIFDFPDVTGDGVADDAPGITAAISAVSTAGGGTIYFPGGHTYLLASLTAAGNLVDIASNVEIVGDGDSTVFKVADGMNDGGDGTFMVFYPPDNTSTISNVRFRDFKVDMNGSNNTGNLLSGNQYQNVTIGVLVGSGVVVDNVTVLNHPGSQVFSFGKNTTPLTVSDVRVTGCRVLNCGVIVNSDAIDFSAIYFYGANGVIANNVFSNSSLANSGLASVCCAIESNAQGVSCVGNTVVNFTRAHNVVAIVASGSQMSIAGNTWTSVRQGVVAFQGATFQLDGVSIIGNTAIQADASAGPFFDFDTNVAGSNGGAIVIANNTVNSSEAAGTANAYPCVRLGPFMDQIVANNVFANVQGDGVDAGSLISWGNVSIVGNLIRDCGRTSNASFKKGISLASSASLGTLRVAGNAIINSSAVYMTTGINIGITGVSRGRVTDNFIQNVTTDQTISTSMTGLWPLGFALSTPSLPAGTGSGNAVANPHDHPVRIYQAGMAGTRIVDKNGTAGAIGVDPTSVDLQPGESIWYATTKPSSWVWYGL